jgi:hypothetical protein
MENILAPKIYTYFSPDPYDSDDCAEEHFFSWIPGYLSGEDEDGTISFFRDENLQLLDKICESFKEDISAALLRLQPLFDQFYLNQLNVALDVSGLLLPSKSTLAGYHTNYSKPAKGMYTFSVDRYMIYQKALYLKNGDKSVLPNLNLWEHELIHLYDHQELVAASMLKDSAIVKNNLDYYCLKYREEGLANLFDLLDGKLRDIQHMEQAMEKFVTSYREAEVKLLNETNTIDKLRKDLYKGYDFYKIGPWLILAILHRDFYFLEDDLDIRSIIEKAALGEMIEDEVKIEVLKRTHYIDNQYFLYAVADWLKSANTKSMDISYTLTESH